MTSKKYYRQHKEKMDKQSSEWRKNHPEYYQQHKKRICESVRRYQMRNPEKNKQSKKQMYMGYKATLHELKINGCAICGYSKCDAALDFHHVNSKDKKFCIIAANITKKNLTDEVQKCILLCKNCHYEIHTEELKDG